MSGNANNLSSLLQSSHISDGLGQLDSSQVNVPSSNDFGSNSEESDDDNYDMEKGGRALIFNQNFENSVKIKNEEKRLKHRNGTKADVRRLDTLFKWLGFTIETYEDKTKDEMEKIIIREASNKENTNISCLVVCILSHGKKEGIYTADGDFMEMESIFKSFNGENCPLMVGKPKIFIVQACRGDETEKLVSFDSASENNGSKNVFVHPADADQAAFYASTLGTVSWRSSKGSWFIQTLCEVFEQGADKLSFHDLTLKVKRKITKKSVNQMFSISEDTLCKNIYFVTKMSFEKFSTHQPLEATS